jgi:hypothetical protein
LTALGKIISTESHENKWPQFLPTVQQLLTSEDPKMLQTGLIALLEYTKVYQWASNAKRAPLIHVIESIYPALQAIGLKLVDSYAFKVGEMVKTICKIFCGSIRASFYLFL